MKRVPIVPRNVISQNISYIPTRVFSKVKPPTFQILTVLSEDAVAKYLDT